MNLAEYASTGPMFTLVPKPVRVVSENMHYCSSCKRDHDISEFAYNPDGTLQKTCQHHRVMQRARRERRRIDRDN